MESPLDCCLRITSRQTFARPAAFPHAIPRPPQQLHDQILQHKQPEKTGTDVTLTHLSGWIKTVDVKLQEGNARVGANLSVLSDVNKYTQPLLGTNDWTFMSVVFDAGDRDQIQVAARLRFFGGTCSGTAWFDDLCLIAIDRPADPNDKMFLRPDFLTPDRRKQNLLENGDFETLPDPLKVEQWLCPTGWKFNSYAQKYEHLGISKDEVKSGTASAQVVAQPWTPDDIRFVQSVKIERKRWYHLSGWVKTSDVQLAQGYRTGANISVLGKYEHTPPLLETNNWTFVAVVFDAGDRESVEVAARLGYNGGTASGTAWFDDLCLIPINKPDDPKAEHFQQPEFLTPERKKQNLIKNFGFELLPELSK